MNESAKSGKTSSRSGLGSAAVGPVMCFQGDPARISVRSKRLEMSSVADFPLPNHAPCRIAVRNGYRILYVYVFHKLPNFIVAIGKRYLPGKERIPRIP